MASRIDYVKLAEQKILRWLYYLEISGVVATEVLFDAGVQTGILPRGEALPEALRVLTLSGLVRGSVGGNTELTEDGRNLAKQLAARDL